MNKRVNTYMIYKKDYYGYVYIWLDVKHQKYIIGSHHGNIDDSYQTSTGGIHVRNIFKCRSHDMKFKVLEFSKVDDRKHTLTLEQKWLDMRVDIANNSKYYNKTNLAGGGFDAEIQNKRVLNGTHHFLGGSIQREYNNKRVKAGTHIFQQKAHRDNVSRISKSRCVSGEHHFCKSEFNKVPIHIECSDGRSWVFDSKVSAVKAGFKVNVIDRVKRYTRFEFIRGSKGDITFKAGDIITLHPV